MSKQKPTVIVHAGFWQEWFSRRGEWECNVYQRHPTSTLERGPLVAELSYPKWGGPEDFKGEASAIAARKMAQG